MKKTKKLIEKRGSTIVLRGAIILLGLAVLAALGFLFPLIVTTTDTGDYLPIFLGLYVPAIPFFFALHQSLKLLGYIDKNEAFSEKSVEVFKSIKYCALTISGLFILAMPYIFYVADKDDAPGGIVMGTVIILASFSIAAFAGLIQKLVQNAIDIKLENDLTV